MPLYDCISVYLSLPVFLVNAERRQPSAATCAAGNSSRRFSSTLSMFARAISVSCASPTSREMKQQRAVAVAGWNAGGARGGARLSALRVDQENRQRQIATPTARAQDAREWPSSPAPRADWAAGCRWSRLAFPVSSPQCA